jgi:hypothetical protein
VVIMVRSLVLSLLSCAAALAQADRQCPPVPDEVLPGSPKWTQYVRYMSEHSDDPEPIRRLAENNNLRAIYLLGFLPRSEASIALLRRLANNTQSVLRDPPPVVALQALAQLQDCEWITIARNRLPGFGSAARFTVTRMLASIGDPAGWPYVSNAILRMRFRRLARAWLKYSPQP